MLGKIISYQVKENNITLNFEKGIRNIVVINDLIVNFNESIGEYNFIPDEFVKKTNINCELNEGIFKLYLKNYSFKVYENFLIEAFLNDKQILKEIIPSEKNDGDMSYDLMAKEGHKIEDNKELKPISLGFELNDDEYIYAMGERMTQLNKKGYYYENWNTDDPSAHNENYTRLYKSIPFYITFNKSYQYGIFFDNHFHSYFDLGKSRKNEVKIEADGGSFSLYFIGGESLKEIVSGYTYISGRAGLPQYFTLGHQQSRWSYMSKDEVLSLARSFRENDIPCDVIHLDIDYMERYKVFTTNKEAFGDFKGFISELHNLGFKVVCIIDPGTKVEAGYETYEKLVKNKMVATLGGEVYINEVWPGESVYPTFNKPETRSFWADEIKKLTELGVDGIWDDMNEPASFKGPLPLDVDFGGTPHKEIHNLYGHFMAQATYEGLKKHTGLRPFVITRACYSGTQKYSTIWTGDNQSLWHHLKMNAAQLASLGLSGFAFAGSDCGGFGGDCTSELMSRWVELSCLVPLFRNHSAYGTRRQEPWTFDEKTTDIYRKYTKLRYSLLPYFYDLFYEESTNGLPLIRPLVLEFQHDSNTFEMNDEFMLGSYILSAPVLDQGVTKRLVYLPKGKWYDFYTKDEYSSGYHIVNAALDTLPLFVKEGAILPKGKFQTNTIELEELTIELFPGASRYIHYQDDGKSFDYENGKYNLYEITHENNHIKIKMLFNGYKKYKRIVFNYMNRSLAIEDFDGEYTI